jgi:hypothetical protein
MNSLVRSAPGTPAIGTRSGSFVWDGTCWVPSPCDQGDAPPFPCPPPGFPPPGCPPWWSGANSPPWYPGANAGVSFGTTAPSNPVRGHFWWNGTALYMFDGAVWVNTAGGGGTPPSSTAPANPVPGQQWFNGTTLYIWDGNAWIPVSQTKTYVQATAPPAPNAGDLWYDGTQMRVWDGSAWELVGPGATVGPVATTDIQFALAQSTTMSVPTAWTILPYTGTPQIDLQTAWDPVTHKLTPKKAGMYAFQARGAAAAGGSCGIAILKNDDGTFTNALASDIIVGIVSATAGGWQNATGFAHMNGTSDFVRVWGWAAGGFTGTGTNPVWSAVAFA